ncbi:MAG: Ldh family oxidoreductase [Phycisphaerae bacterium]|nr:Ldh family oxidoreductase [Phycisphaerae bacterium]
MSTTYVFPEERHNQLVAQVYQARGYEKDESEVAAYYAGLASKYGIKTHAALKALHLEHLFGTGCGLAKPGAKVEEIDTGYPAVAKLNANLKLGQPVARQAMRMAMDRADKYGIGMVVVDRPFHYLWGGGYVLEAAQKGYIAYTNCTATLAEVVPFGGKFPTIGTNPHTWGFPTQAFCGHVTLIDWATSAVAMGRVQQLKREGLPLPEGSAVDAGGSFTTDPDKVFGLMPFGGKLAGHKGYGLGLIDELYAAYTGGFLPTIRGHKDESGDGKNRASCYMFQAIKPEAMGAATFASRGEQDGNVRAVIADVLGHGNDKAILPGWFEHQAYLKSEELGGLLFTEAEIREFAEAFEEAGVSGFDPGSLKKV